MDHSKCLRFVSYFWSFVGNILNAKGLYFLFLAINNQECSPLFVFLSFGFGCLNGEVFFKQIIKRSVVHINSLSSPIRVTDIYDSKHYLLFASMLGLGFFLQGLAVSSVIWASVDVILGLTMMSVGKAYVLSIKKVSTP